MKTVGKIAIYVLIVAMILAISYLATAGLVWLVCWAFKWPWSWKISLGVWALIYLVSSVFKTVGGEK